MGFFFLLFLVVLLFLYYIVFLCGSKMVKTQKSSGRFQIIEVRCCQCISRKQLIVEGELKASTGNIFGGALAVHYCTTFVSFLFGSTVKKFARLFIAIVYM